LHLFLTRRDVQLFNVLEDKIDVVSNSLKNKERKTMTYEQFEKKEHVTTYYCVLITLLNSDISEKEIKQATELVNFYGDS